MSKKRAVVLNYNGQRILLDAVAGYTPLYKKKERGSEAQYGIRFYLRTGEVIDKMGNDDVSRDNVIKYLDDHFKPDHFTASKCQVCIHKQDEALSKCSSLYDCSSWGGKRGFEREKANA